jgi:hypothetical protein
MIAVPPTYAFPAGAIELVAVHDEPPNPVEIPIEAGAGARLVEPRTIFLRRLHGMVARRLE